MKISLPFLILFAVFSGPLVWAAPTELEIKAAYLKHFIAFTRGFENTDNKIRVGLFVTPESYKIFSILHGKSTLHGTIELHRLDTRSDLLKCCDVLFYGADTNAPVLPESVTRPVLTIGDYEKIDFEDEMIKLVRLGNKLKFQVNIDRAKEAGLIFESHLINLAIRAN